MYALSKILLGFLGRGWTRSSSQLNIPEGQAIRSKKEDAAFGAKVTGGGLLPDSIDKVEKLLCTVWGLSA